MPQMWKIPVFIFLLFSFIHSSSSQSQNGFLDYSETLKRFEERLYRPNSIVQNFSSPQIDLQFLWDSLKDLDSSSLQPDGHRHDSHSRIIGRSRYSQNPSFLKAVRYSSSWLDTCNWLHPNVDKKCCRDLQIVFSSLLLKELWAIKMVDSMGKPPSGMLYGDSFFPGSYDECLNLVPVYDFFTKSGIHKRHSWFQPKYCQIAVQIENIKNPFNPKGLMTIGLCVPDSCQASDIEFLFDVGITSLSVWIGGKDNTFICHEEREFTAQAIAALGVCSAIVLLLIAGTLYDVIGHVVKGGQDSAKVIKPKSKAPESLEMTQFEKTPKVVEEKKAPRIEPGRPRKEFEKLAKFLLCFSLYKNISKLLNTNLSEKILVPIHGVRFISMTWIILGQTYIMGAYVWRNNMDFARNLKSFSFHAIANATVSVDTFFLISGLLVVYGGLKTMKKKEEKGVKMDWLQFYIHRYWRLTPTYMFVLMVYICLMPYFGDGPYWPQNGDEEKKCVQNWWQNVLYINNFFDNQCMSWMWYLANEIQFFFISPFILVFLKKKPLGALIWLLFLTIVQCVITGFLWLSQDRNPLTGQTPDVYMRPYTRIGPYLIGMAYGYLLYKLDGKLRINRFLTIVLWLLSTAVAMSVLYGMYGNYNGNVMTKEVAAIYMSVHRNAWAIAVGWVICACVTGHGGIISHILSYPAFVPLSRLTYSAYLVHPIVMFTYYLSQRFPIYATNFRAVHIHFGHLFLSYLTALAVSMAIEAPMANLEKLFLSIKNPRPQPKESKTPDPKTDEAPSPPPSTIQVEIPQTFPSTPTDKSPDMTLLKGEVEVAIPYSTMEVGNTPERTQGEELVNGPPVAEVVLMPRSLPKNAMGDVLPAPEMDLGKTSTESITQL